MKIAFYAPMKSPRSAKPSGDRTIGRLLIGALELAGHDVEIVSELRTWSSDPDPEKLAALESASREESGRLVGEYQCRSSQWQPDVWLTYHSYYKAPDLLGPDVANALSVPYVIVEASYSSRRAMGRWANWLGAVRRGLERCDCVLSFTARDQQGLNGIVPAERSLRLPPFLDLSEFPSPPGTKASAGKPVRLVTVAMMRPGAKLRSYGLLATALGLVQSDDWQLEIIGDGSARAAVEAAFASLPADRIHWHGALDRATIGQVLAAGDLFVWPGIEEAFGMAYLEAQATGLAVVACHTAGVPEVVHHEETGWLAADTTAASFAGALERLLSDSHLRRTLSARAYPAIERHHSIAAASARLDRVLCNL